MSVVRDLLKNIYVFNQFTPKELDRIAQVSERVTYNAGNPIITEGHKADAMYVVEHGTLRMLKSGEDEHIMGLLGSGAHFGELPFLDGMPRALSVEATEKTILIVIPYDKLEQVLASDPTLAAKLYKEIARYLSSRLRKVTTDLSFVRQKNLKHF